MEDKIHAVPLRLPPPEREMLNMICEEENQSLNGMVILLIRKDFHRRKLTLPDPLPEPKKRK